MIVNDPPPSYEVATGIAIPTTQTLPAESNEQQQQQQQQQQCVDRNGVPCLVVNTSEVKSMPYSKVGLAILIFFCFCGAIGIVVYFFADD